MLQIEKYFNFIDEALTKANIPPESISDFRQKLDAIDKRYKDPNLYLSTVSDFSSGKSTIINTLIGQKLLKTAILATTAVPTYIRNHSGDGVIITVKTAENKFYNLNEENGRAEFELYSGVKLPSDTGDIISTVTTDDAFQKSSDPFVHNPIDEIHISVPYSSGVENLCIIDTPGVNPGTRSAAHHAEKTQRILSDVADAAIILFPADQAYTHSFEKFLDNNAQAFMNDGIFVITMMDRVEEEEREEVYQVVRRNLTQHFRLDNPLILTCSAGRVGKDPYWTEQFGQFRTSLYGHLRQNRDKIIEQKLSKLLRELLDAINVEIADQNRLLEERIAILRENAVPNLKKLLDDMYDDSKDKLTKRMAAFDAELNGMSKRVEDSIRAQIQIDLNGLKTRSDVEKYAKNNLSQTIEAKCENYKTTAGRCTDDLNTAAQDVSKEMLNTLDSYYGRIGKITLENRTDEATLNFGQMIDTRSKTSVASDFGSKIDTVTMFAGAGIAAVVFASLGPIGWIAGGVAALVGGDRLFVDSSKKKVTEAVFPKIPGIVSDVRKETKNKVDSYFQSLTSSLIEQKLKWLEQYSTVYNELDRTLKAQMKEITDQLNVNTGISRLSKAYISEITGEQPDESEEETPQSEDLTDARQKMVNLLRTRFADAGK